MSGLTWSILQLGYDLYCLQAKNALPSFVVERLRERRSFQGARYEIAAAAVMQRAGFDVRFLDSANQAQKHCEFMATCRLTGVQAGVEAKSRVRPGVLNAPGDRQDATGDDICGFANLVRKAKRQAPEGVPFFIFLDVNVPPSDKLDFNSGWIHDLKEALSTKPSKDSPDTFTAFRDRLRGPLRGRR